MPCETCENQRPGPLLPKRELFKIFLISVTYRTRLYRMGSWCPTSYPSHNTRPSRGAASIETPPHHRARGGRAANPASLGHVIVYGRCSINIASWGKFSQFQVLRLRGPWVFGDRDCVDSRRSVHLLFLMLHQRMMEAIFQTSREKSKVAKAWARWLAHRCASSMRLCRRLLLRSCQWPCETTFGFGWDTRAASCLFCVCVKQMWSRNSWENSQ